MASPQVQTLRPADELGETRRAHYMLRPMQKGAEPCETPNESHCVHRSLNQSQRALIAAGFLEYERELARARQAHGSTAPGKTLPETFLEANPGEARDKAGERCG